MKIQYLAIYCALFCLAFDFRGDEGGNWVTYIATAASCMFLTLGIFLNKAASATFDKFWGWGALLFISLSNSLIRGIEISVAAKMLFPFLLFFLAAAAVRAAARNGLSFSTAVTVLCYIFIINASWKWFYAISVSGISVDVVRFQMLSAAIIFALSISFSRIFFESTSFGLLTVVAVLAAVTAILSATRTLLLVGVSLFVLSVFWRYWVEKIVASRGLRSQSKFEFKLMLGVGIAAFIVIPAVLAIKPEIFWTWEYRLETVFSAGSATEDTGGMRLAQTRGMLSALGESLINWTTGVGFGARYGIDPQYLTGMNVSNLSASKVDEMLHGALVVDSTWVPLLFTGGLLSLVFVLRVFYHFVKFILENIYVPDKQRRMYVRDVAFFIFAVLSASFTGHILSDRLFSIIFGVYYGFVLHSLESRRFEASNALGRVRRFVPRDVKRRDFTRGKLL